MTTVVDQAADARPRPLDQDGEYGELLRVEMLAKVRDRGMGLPIPGVRLFLPGPILSPGLVGLLRALNGRPPATF